MVGELPYTLNKLTALYDDIILDTAVLFRALSVYLQVRQITLVPVFWLLIATRETRTGVGVAS